MVLVAVHHPCDVGRFSVDPDLEKTSPKKVWKHNQLKATKSRSIRT